MNEPQLRAAIGDLAVIEADGNLGDVQIAFAAACRQAGGIPDTKERKRQTAAMEPAAAVRAKCIGKAAAHFFGLAEPLCTRLATEVLAEDPWSEIALDCIASYLPCSDPAPVPQETQKQSRGRKW